MASSKNITDVSDGAHFYRADLHVHSYQASHDVRDAGMTPAAIIKSAISEGLEIISITDHNEISNVEAVLKAAQGTKVVVIPGIELSTPQGHLLCYLPTLDALKRFHASLKLADNGTTKSHCKNGMSECLDSLRAEGGFGILAHVDSGKGFEQENPGMTQHKLDVLCHSALLGIEVLDASSPVTYADGDVDQTRATASNERIKRLSLGSKQYLARVLNSDAHELSRVGKNSKGQQRVTRFKANIPSFDSLRIALEDSDARVRIEDQIPESIPHVVGIRMEGGFLDGQIIHFSRNLNCIIGGRGAGKSTAFEAVRCLSGDSSENKVVDSEVWPSQLYLVWEDQAGQKHSLLRPTGGPVTNIDDPRNGPTSFKVESYGQGETADISKQAQSNPLALLGYLDRFVDVAEPASEEDSARDEMLEYQKEIELADKDVKEIPECERALNTAQQQLEALKQAKATEVIELQQKLEDERAIRTEVADKLTEIEEDMDSVSATEAIEALVDLVADPSKLAVGGGEFKKIVASARAFEKATEKAFEKARESLETFQEETEVQIAEWKTKETKMMETIEKKRKVLAAQNIPLDMGFIQKLTRSQAKLKMELEKLKKAKPRLAKLRRDYEAASKKRWEARERVATIRDAYGKRASQTLRGALKDLTVSLKFERSAYSTDAEKIIAQTMGWRTNQIPRAALLIRALSMPSLLDVVDKKDVSAIMAIIMPDGTKAFSKTDADEIILRLSESAIRFALERFQVHDLPCLSVTKPVQDTSGKLHYITRDFAHLSLGQQQSVLLALMLSSGSNAPLIIDQPEDNLDGEFIYHSLVPVLRLAKERRQIIVVTHNPNIAVLGDAEEVVVLKSTSEKGSIVARGSIDDEDTRAMACNILEGAREAFKMRAKIYGV